ncbi:MAG: CYTH domain-containing protein [Erysipelotrichaceae bacterium]|nr:CYTH domain-containing protein [Erysipelotrichaceae bacterium]
MSNAIEIEAKALVSKSDYEKLVAKYKDYGAYEQTNYYIDSPDNILQREKLALRIRKRDNHYEMTLKVPLSQGLLEKNCTWNEATFVSFRDQGIFPDGDIKKMLLMLDIDPASLKIKTSLTTERIDVPYEGGKLSIDQNHYSGQTDYEIELEYNNEKDAEAHLEALFQANHIPFVLNKKSKVARAMAAYEAKLA